MVYDLITWFLYSKSHWSSIWQNFTAKSLCFAFGQNFIVAKDQILKILFRHLVTLQAKRNWTCSSYENLHLQLREKTKVENFTQFLPRRVRWMFYLTGAWGLTLTCGPVTINSVAITLFFNWWFMGSFVEGDEQPDRLNSQKMYECIHAFAAYIFWFVINTTTYPFCWYSLHLLLLESSIDDSLDTWIELKKPVCCLMHFTYVLA